MSNSPTAGPSRGDDGQHLVSRESQPSEADRAIVQAEQFKAAIAKPTGKDPVVLTIDDPMGHCQNLSDQHFDFIQVSEHPYRESG